MPVQASIGFEVHNAPVARIRDVDVALWSDKNAHRRIKAVPVSKFGDLPEAA